MAPPQQFPSDRPTLSPHDAICLLPNENRYNSGLQVIGAGFGRTGTLSLKAALTILLGGSCYHMKENIINCESDFWDEAVSVGKAPEEWRTFFRLYSAVVDAPACMFWKHLLHAHPNAKVILSTRDTHSWVRSVTATIMNFQPGNEHRPLGVKLFQLFMPIGPGLSYARMMKKVWDDKVFRGDYSSAGLSTCFENWNASVINDCPVDRLLVFEAKDGWEPLCSFLGVPVPNCPYPHVNDTSEFKQVVAFVNLLGYAISGGLLASALLLGRRLWQGRWM
eukprot:GSChrysophyteH1.ASY1.ANO1.965.1 assembled CDS